MRVVCTLLFVYPAGQKVESSSPQQSLSFVPGLCSSQREKSHTMPLARAIQLDSTRPASTRLICVVQPHVVAAALRLPDAASFASSFDACGVKRGCEEGGCEEEA